MTSYIMQPDEISMGVICPLPIEVAAMIQMLDERYGTQQFPRDSNFYHFGRIGKHKIVIVGLPDGLPGIASATRVAQQLGRTFCVKALLLVGIGGGVPTTKNDMRLGDVVVSRPDGRYGGVVQYDFGKSLSEGRFEHTGALNSPPWEALSTLTAMKANHFNNGTRQPEYIAYLEASQSNHNLKNPGAENDILFEAGYNHVGGSDCTACDKARETIRKPRKASGPVIHYGTVASANQLMRDSKKRDSYNKDYDGRILCFEMEAAGLMMSIPCLVIRGISDYADSHKREDHAWHGYAAAAAAAFAKEFINTIPSTYLNSMSPVAEVIVNDGSESVRLEALSNVPPESSINSQPAGSKSLTKPTPRLTSNNQTTVSSSKISLESSDTAPLPMEKINSSFINAARNGETGFLISDIRKHNLNPRLDQNSINVALIELSRHPGHDGRRLKAVTALVDKCNANLDYRDSEKHRTPLMWAACSGYAPIVKYLLDRGASVAEVDDIYKRTSLSWATAKRDSLEVVKLLLNSLSNPQITNAADVVNKEDVDRKTALGLAYNLKQLNSAKALLNHDADPNINVAGVPLLVTAVQWGSESFVRLLVEKGANTRCMDLEGIPVLSIAIKSDRSLDLIQFLIAKGADIEARDLQRRTPSSWAFKKNRVDVLDLLVQKRATNN